MITSVNEPCTGVNDATDKSANSLARGSGTRVALLQGMTPQEEKEVQLAERHMREYGRMVRRTRAQVLRQLHTSDTDPMVLRGIRTLRILELGVDVPATRAVQP